MKKIVLVFVLVGFGLISKAQLFVDTIYTVPQMVNDFFDSSCVSISNISFQGSNTSMNFFDASLSNVGLNMGILLTSGTVMNAVGPNVMSSISNVNSLPGDTDLTLLAGVPTYDASVLEFDLVPHVDTIFFQYVFGSEEYSEFATSPFNDVFAFYIQGPGYATPTNIALIPGTTTPVAVNNVNCILQSPFYVCNDPLDSYCDTSYHCQGTASGATVEYDGFTTPLTCYAVVQIDSVYHIKIGVADASDQVFDSSVFLSCQSLCGNGQRLAANFTGTPTVNNREISFTNQTNYARSYNWNFGDGSFNNERNPVHTYAADGLYNVQLIATNAFGSDTAVNAIQVGTAGLATNNLGVMINVFPNPFLKQFEINQFKNELLHVELFDINGELIWTKTTSDNEIEIDCNNEPDGIYFLKVTGKQFTMHKVLTKN